MVSFHIVGLTDEKYRMPLLARICGRVYITPKTSGSQHVSASMANSSRKKRFPNMICRTMLSPPGRLPSGSTYIAPIASQRPSAIRSRTSAYTRG